MEQYIKKSDLLAEIKKCIYKCNEKKRSCPVNTQVEAICDNKINAYNEILSSLNTLEVKEVDYYRPIDKDFERDAVNFCFDNALNTTPRIAKTIAKHFFELGLKIRKGEEV